MKATVFSRIGLVATVLALIVSLGSAQTYAAPALSPDAAGVAAPGEPKGGSNGNQGNSGDNGKSQGSSGNTSGGQQGNSSNAGGGNSNAGGNSSNANSGGNSANANPGGANGGNAGGNGGGQGGNQGGNGGSNAGGGGNGQNADTGHGNPGPNSGVGQITICHATGSVDNPYLRIGVAVNSTDWGGHRGHDGDFLSPTGACPSGTPVSTATPGTIQQPTAVATQVPATATAAPTQAAAPTATPTPKAEDKKNPDDREGNNNESQLTTGGTPLGGAAQASGQGASGVVAGSAPGQAPEVLGQIASAPARAADGLQGVQQEAGLGASAAGVDPALLPYTGYADGPSSLPGFWMAAGLLLSAAGLFVRRSALATADR